VEDTANIDATPPNWNEKAAYVYDGLNRRVKKDLDSGTDILYIYDGWQCIEERNAASPSTVLRQYAYGGQYIDEIVCKIEDPGGTPGKLFYLHDCNYNVVALTNTSAAVQERYNYEPYGGLTIAEADYDVISATTQNNSLTFQGQRYDAESGLYYFRNRYLSPVIGRFLQRDPDEYADGMSLYSFVHDAPVGRRDPQGLWELKWHRPLTEWVIYGTWPAQKEPYFVDCGDLEGGISSVACLYTRTFRYHFERQGNFEICQCDLDVIHGDIRYTSEKFEVNKIDFKLGIPLGYGQEVEVSLGHWVYWTDYEMGDKRREARRGECLKLRPRPEFEGEPAPGERDKAKAVGCPE